MTAGQKYKLWLEKADDPKTLSELNLMNEYQINDAFFKDLEFGTAGMRGIMGAGSNRMNIYTVLKTSQGVADYLFKYGTSKGICISYDCRNNSWLFAQTAARVFASCGIKVYVGKVLAPTPYLSFITRFFKADMGVMITASHNGREYNGYKVYGPDGSQLTDLNANRLKEFIDKVDPFLVKTDPFSHYLRRSMIQFVSLRERYLKEVKLHSFLSVNLAGNLSGDDKKKKIKVVYSPLCGTGGIFALQALKCLDVELYKVKEQMRPDGHFKTCPSPNPEREEAYALALAEAKKVDGDLILVTDPDADRAGVMVKTHNGYQALSGNETGALLTDYLLHKNKERSQPVENPVIVRTVVTTSLTDKIARKNGAELKEVLTGFKYIGEYVSQLEKKNEQDRFLLGFEDSYGYLSGDYVRDKDGIQACLLIASMASEYADSGKTLIDAMEDLYKEFGYHLHKTLSFKFEGQEGMLKILELMDSLRNNPVLVTGMQIKGKTDYLTSQNGLPTANMVKLEFDNYTITVRPSGTEPLIKVYITLIGQKEKALALLSDVVSKCQAFFS